MTATASQGRADLPSDLRTLLDTPLAEIPMSVRATNVLKLAGIERLGELIQETEHSLLSLQNCGRKSVKELRQLVEARGLRLGLPADGWEPPDENSAEEPLEGDSRRGPKIIADYRPEIRAVLFLKIEELGLPQRAANVCARLKLRQVGDLAQATAGKLRKTEACGALTISQIEERLAQFGLQLGMEISDWETARTQPDREDRRRVEELRLSLSELPPTACLEDELLQIVSSVTDARATDIVVKLNGFSGAGPRTLESVGEEYDLTRERIRQIAAKALRKFEHRKFLTPWLAAALTLLDRNSPCYDINLSRQLRERGISRGDFDVGGIVAACDVLGRKFEFASASIKGRKVYGRAACLKKARLFFRECRRATSSGGCANFEAICDDIDADKQQRSFLRDIATLGDTCVWLDDDHQWLSAVSTSRNRLSNLIGKVFAVAPLLPIAELRRAIGRSRRLQVVPPTTIISRFISVFRLGRVVGDIAHADLDFKEAIRPGGTEETLILVLQLHGPVLGWDRFQELCVEAGMNPITFGIYASTSPVLSRLARGVYSLVGADVPPGLVEEIQNECAASRRRTEWGWTSRGSLWCALPLSLTTIIGGACPLPSFVEKLTEGEWQPSLGEKQLEKPLRCKAGFISGLRHSLAIAGAEAGDVCVLEFHLASRKANLFVGGEELVDLWDNGLIDLPAPDALEIDEERSGDDTLLIDGSPDL